MIVVHPGMHWTKLTVAELNPHNWAFASSVPNTDWYGVVWADTLGLFVAVGLWGVMTSPDGDVWTARTAASSNTWRAIDWNGSILVAVSSTGTGDRVMTSTDGITWTSRVSAADQTWTTVYWDGTYFIAGATGTASTNNVMRSTDGITWSLTSLAVAGRFYDFVYAEGKLIATAVDTGTSSIAYSSDHGDTWTFTNSLGFDYVCLDYSSSLDLYVAASNLVNNVGTSSDGTTWNNAAGTYPETDWEDMLWIPALGRFVTVNSAGGTATVRAAYSTDGVTWTSASTPGDPPNNSLWHDMAWSPEEGVLVVVGDSSVDPTHCVMSSTTGA